MEKELDCCEVNEVHSSVLQKIIAEMPDEIELYNLAELFKVFGDSTRIRILYVLFEAEVCVCDLASALNMNQSAISHQLKILKQNKYNLDKSLLFFTQLKCAILLTSTKLHEVSKKQ